MGGVRGTASGDRRRALRPPPSDAVVVLGTQEYAVWPSRSFAARLDNAFSLYEEGLAPLVIAAGGDPEGDSYTEVATGVRYLEDQGLPILGAATRRRQSHSAGFELRLAD